MEGFSVGWPEGCADGCKLGRDEGWLLGCTDGLTVGNEEG
jgi:hypothetical protein